MNAPSSLEPNSCDFLKYDKREITRTTRRKFPKHGDVNYVWIALIVLLICSCDAKENLGPGDKAPHFELKTLGGEPFRFAPPFEKTQIIYFWAVWCSYCEDDLKMLDKLYSKWKNTTNSPHLVAINAGQPESRVRKYIKKLDPAVPIYLDLNIKVAHRFGVRGLPTYYITDKKGVIEHIIFGWADEKTLLDKINRIK